MGRPVVLSNGQLFVGLDENGLVHDFYYPYVGLDNLTNARNSQHKIGIWVDGRFSWVNHNSWQTDVSYEVDGLISHVSLQSLELRIKLELTDFIDIDTNTLIRRITVTNQSSDHRDVRLFMHQVFQISRAGRADTAMYVPDDNYLLDYKGRCCLLIAGQFLDGGDFDQFAVGNYGIEGKAGTFQDAEDGELSGNTVEHGGVDSILRFRQELDANKSFAVDYWVVAANSESDAQVVHTKLKYHSIDERLDSTRKYWHDWLSSGDKLLVKLDSTYRQPVRLSELVIKAHCDERGSVLASGDSSIFNYGRDYYCYCWPRDAAYAIWPLMRLGHFDEARRFFEFARDTMHRDGYMMHKYQPDRAIGSTWHPLLHGKHKELAIQEDETASVIIMLGEYYRLTKDKTFIENFYEPFIVPTARFMCGFIDEATGLPHASYDLWEQKFLTSTYTTSTVIAALEIAAELAIVLNHPEDSVPCRKAAELIKSNLSKLYNPEGYFRKGFLLQEDGSLDYDDTLDISNLYGPFMFARLELDDERLVSTARLVEAKLLNTSPVGGVIRYENDEYFLTKNQYKGNPWVVCSLWLAQYYIGAKQQDKAKSLIDWSLARTIPSGILSEQFDPENGLPLGVTPLVWSHAELINSLLDLGEIAYL